MTCVLLSSSAASVADAEFVAEITDFVVSRKTFVWCFPCQNDCPTRDNDSRKADCSETSFHSSPVEQRLQNAWFSRECSEKFRVVFTPPHLLCAILRDDFQLDNLASRKLGSWDSRPWRKWNSGMKPLVIFYCLAVRCMCTLLYPYEVRGRPGGPGTAQHNAALWRLDSSMIRIFRMDLMKQ